MARPKYDQTTAGDYAARCEKNLASAKSIIDRAERENRDLSVDEAASVDALQRFIEEDRANQREAMQMNAWEGTNRRTIPEPVDCPTPRGRNRKTANDSECFVDPKSGARLPVLTRNQKFADLSPNPFPEIRNPIGSAIVAAVSGNTRGLPGEFRSMLSSITTSGGYLCDESIAAPLIDKSRANMVLSKAGCLTIAYDTSTGSIARVETDPTAYVKGEGDAFTESAIVFGSTTLTPRTCGIYVTMSRELAEDCVNGAEEIERVIANAFAAKLDTWGISGTDSQQPQGLIFQSGVNTITSVGSPTYDDLIDGAKLCMDDNFDVSANATFVAEPSTWKTLVQIKEATTNAYLAPPPTLRDWQFLYTSAMASGYAVLGDFREFAIALRQGIHVEVTSTGDTTFSKHTIAVKAFARVSFVCLRPTAFCVLSGIS